MLTSGLLAQNDKGAKIVTVSQAIKSNGYTIQVGLPILGVKSNARITTPIDVRFPWDALYLYKTFADESFSVSKGYYGDKILINWDLRANSNLVSSIKIYRRKYNPLSPNANWGLALTSLAATAKEFEDKYVDGGVLYEYKVHAIGINDAEILYANYISGIGFRSPTAIVTGNINFKGGNPVKDVTVRATSKGGSTSSGTAISIPIGGKIEIKDINRTITTVSTIQAWMKPETPYTDDSGVPIRLFKIESNSALEKAIEVTVNLKAISNILEVSIGGSVYQLKNYYPSGNINGRGDDELVPVSSFNTNFVHFSVILNDGEVPSLFVNGRLINEKYRSSIHSKLLAAKDVSYTAPYFLLDVPTSSQTNSLALSGIGSKWDNVYFGGGRNAILDELRIWNIAIDTSVIRTDYKRFISGNHSNLSAYLSANEGAGDYTYDWSRVGFVHNKNNGKLVDGATWVTGAGNAPTSTQLGVLGVSDANGNYEINSIPYSGTGESYTITPMYGQHKFEPNQQLVFLGQGSEVANKIDFVDKSSFSFKGEIMFDSRGVFPSFVDIDGKKTTNEGSSGSWIDGTGIVEAGYNYYQKGDDKFSKGEYWLNTAGTPSVESDDYLDKYARIYVEGANIYIDGVMVLDANNLPVLSDKEGKFDISVPIGNHFITVKKDGHLFDYAGRFPAQTGTFKEFFEDSNEPVVFIDTTKVSIIGKVVGGSIEANKTTGFGANGFVALSDLKDANGNPKIVEKSAKNNIGVAKFILGYNPPGSNGTTGYTKSTFFTNSSSGEYRVNLLPLQYELLASDLTIPSASEITLIRSGSTETLDFSKIETIKIPEFKYTDGTVEKSQLGLSYHYEKSFVFRSTPVLQVTQQTSDETISVAGVDMPTTTFTKPVYTQFKTYQIKLKRFERYTNKDNNGNVEVEVPVTDGELVKTNNLALANSESVITNPANASGLIYSFKAGLPSIVSPFEKTSSLMYRLSGVDYPVENFKSTGIILGGQSDGSQTFVTEAPDRPDIILRDPPGSNSFASIEKGETISFQAETSTAATLGASSSVEFMLGIKFAAGGGLAGPVIETQATNNLTVGVGLSSTSTDGKSVTNTYTFNKTISTSSDPEYVGSDGDLYIGNSKNVFYGSYDNITASNSIPKKMLSGVSVPLDPSEYINLGTDSAPIYISKQKAIYFNEEPSSTFFIHSQKHILTSLIPEYELFISNSENGPDPMSDQNVKKRAQYAEKIRLWRKLILDNEKSKYLAKNQRAKYKAKLIDVLNIFNSKVNTALSANDDPISKSKLTSQLLQSSKTKNLLESNFEKNISFDAGSGEFSQSIETSVISASSTAYNLTLDESIEGAVGFQFNTTGIIVKPKAFFQQDINSSLAEESTATTKIAYTLKDSDPANFLSVDAVNAFDGFGPIFITQGGRTSCPNEGEETSMFFPADRFNSYYTSFFAKQEELKAKDIQIDSNEKAYQTLLKNSANEAQKMANRASKVLLMEQRNSIQTSLDLLDRTFESNFDGFKELAKAPLSFATQKVEVPVLAVTNNNMTNILDGKNAEFELKLENNSASGSDADFKLVVDNTTNPNNALINIEPNGTIVHVPYGSTVIYKLTLGKSISDVYEYNNIKVRLESLCDGVEVSSSVLVSAKFVPSCSEVIVSTPLSNWVYNRESAFNADGTTKPLPINLTGFNTSFASFKKIDLEYRLATASNWTRLHTYYTSQVFLDAATETSEKSLIGSQTSLSYALNIAGLALPDGKYEIRARSSCTNNTEFISQVSTGSVDLIAPVKFGTPLPTDGILGPGEDLKLTFNEPVSYNPAVSTIQIKGQTNQLRIDHQVSLYFEGANNIALINNPRISSGDLTVEFWMKNTSPSGSAVILSQKDGIKIEFKSGKIYFTIGGITADGLITSDGLFHHYTFTHKNSSGEVAIFRDDTELASKTGALNVSFSNNEALIIGGNTFIGNIHGLRLWNKSISLSDSYSRMYDKLIGNESNLIGYWPMDEGRGTIANDKARYKHAEVKAAWDIKPKGTSYAFSNNQHLELNNVGFVQLTEEMDASISFWVKTNTLQNATLFSNGRGDGTDVDQSGALDNKWAIHINNSGILSFSSEGKNYLLTTKSIVDDNWHHVSLLLNRQGSLKTYLDGEAVSSNDMTSIGGFSGNKIWLGARGFKNLAGLETVDQQFTGKIDEFQLWNTLRNEEQINRDKYFELDEESIGLMLYARMNEPDPVSVSGPRYFHAFSNQSVISSVANLSSGVVNYSSDAPAIKPERTLINFQVNRVISGNAMIIEPIITDIASIEGQVLDITVHRMFDAANNMQQSPITWTAYNRRNEVTWYAEGYNEIIDIVKEAGSIKSFEITILNKGGTSRPYTISNMPKWLSLSRTTGTIAPDSRIIITATIDKDFSAGEYLENLNLQTDFGFDEKLQIKLRVLAKDPLWAVNSSAFNQSMTVVGRIKVNGVFSEDAYDQIAAFVNGEVRGVAKLTYNPVYMQYYAFLTVYSKVFAGENITFKIWDASEAKILETKLNDNLTLDFEDNGVNGSLSSPAIFNNTTLLEQNIAINKGWSWVSMNVLDANFKDINQLTKNLLLDTDDRIVNGSDQETYSKNISIPTWSGTISASGGLSVSKMYKIFMANEQTLSIKGIPIDIASWSFVINRNWNWFPFPFSSSQLTSEALAYFDASDGDVIKSQNLFAIYDAKVGWNGTLRYLEPGKGYMLKSTKEQTLKYPTYLVKSMGVAKYMNSDKASNSNAGMPSVNQEQIRSEFKKYSQNMNAIVHMPKGFNELMVYDTKGALKGIASRKGDQDLVFITIYGEGPETMVFHIGSGNSQKKTNSTINFKNNDVLGTIAKPIIITELSSDISIYPTPFDSELTLELRADRAQKAVISLYSNTSHLVFNKEVRVENGVNTIKILPNIMDGVYILQIKLNGQIVVSKIVKYSGAN